MTTRRHPVDALGHCPGCGLDLESTGGLFFPRGTEFTVQSAAMLLRRTPKWVRNRLSEHRDAFTRRHETGGLGRPIRVLSIQDVARLRDLRGQPVKHIRVSH